MGRDAIGQVIFDAAGQVSLQLMQRKRPAFASGDRALGTPAEFQAAFVGFLSYFGTYTFDAGNGTLTMLIEGSSFPNLVGTKQVRHVEIAEPRFTGTTPPVAVAGKLVTGVFVWERVR